MYVWIFFGVLGVKLGASLSIVLFLKEKRIRVLTVIHDPMYGLVLNSKHGCCQILSLADPKIVCIRGRGKL